MVGPPPVVFIRTVLLTRGREESGTTLHREPGHLPPPAPMPALRPNSSTSQEQPRIVTRARSRPSITSPKRDRPRLGTARPGLVDTASAVPVATRTNAVQHTLHAAPGSPGMGPFLSQARRAHRAPDAAIVMAARCGAEP